MSKEGLERIQKSLEDYKKKMFEHLVNSAYFPSVPLINSLLKGKTDQSAIII